MKSTWRNNREQWGFYHHLLDIVNVHPTNFEEDVPVFRKDQKLPYISSIETHKWVVLHTLWPLLLHQSYAWASGHNMNPLCTAFYYTVAFKINVIHQIHLMRYLGHKVGFLDGDEHPRDEIPDDHVSKIVNALITTSVLRPFIAVYLTYSTTLLPTDLSWWATPIEIGLYGIVLDFYYYWYHRALHEVGFLWRFHRTHHLTKHPNPLLTVYVDGVQELFDIAIVPLVTWATLVYLGLPMGFYEWWICHEYVVFTEVWGHSGLRVYITAPTTCTPLLKLFNAELRTEDHDLHHRHGYKKSGNYGKQTLLWDRMFGTVKERVEFIPSNVDWNIRIGLPLLFRIRSK